MDHADRINGLIERRGAEEPRGKAYEDLKRRYEERTTALVKANETLQAEINERKKLEETLQEEKNKLQSMADALKYGLTIQDRDYNIIYQNKFMADTFGGLGEKCYRAYEGKDKICDGCPVEMAYRDGRSHTSERRVVMTSGEIAYYENTANPIRNAKGEILTCFEIVRDVTKRKGLEETLQEEKNKLQSMADAMEYGLTIQDRDYHIIYQNKFLADTFGGLGEKCYRVYEGKDQICDGCPVEMAYRDGRSHTSERRVVMTSGEIAYYENTANPIRNAKGEIVTCLEIARDITERKRSDEALRESEQRFRDVVDSMDGWLWEVDENGAYTYCSEKCEEILGVSPEEMLGKTPFDFMAQGEAERIGETFSKTVREKKPIKDLENWNIRKEGTPVCLLTNGLPILDEKGELKGYRGIDKDISERKQAEEALERYARDLETAKADIENIIRSMIDALIVVTPQGVIKSANRSALHSLGYEEHELISQPVGMVFAEGALFSDTTFQTEMTKGSASDHDATLRTKRGEEIPISLSASPKRDREGRLDGWIVIARDMRESRLVKELERANRELKETTVQLVQSEKLSALGELTAGVAHELNQPLNGIKIISQSLLRDIEKNRLENGEVRDDLKEIVDQVNKMAEIIDHMRIYSRKSEGMSQELLNVNLLIEGPFKLLEQQLRNHDIEVKRELDAHLPQVKGDPIRLEQVLMNIITNARNALDSCGKKDKRIEVRSYRDGDRLGSAKNGSVVVEVKDNGDGIPDDIKEKIFEPFFTTKEAGKGTGLGLSVSSKIIEEHGGKIEVISKVGDGATFNIILPVAG